MKRVNDKLNQARNAFRRTPNDLPEGVSPETAKAALINSKYALLKPEEHLTQLQSEKLAEVKSVSPQLALMHASQEAFRALFKAENSTLALFGLLD